MTKYKLNNNYFKILLLSVVLIALGSCGSSKKVNTSRKPNSRPVVTAKPSNTNRQPSRTSKPSSSTDQTLEATSTIKVTPQNVQEYIATFKATAQTNMRQHGIPASIIMAQGILESGIGKGKLAREANNHFGIKCHVGWSGEVIYHDDDSAAECFRKYKDASESYRDHGLFLTSRSRYNALFQLQKDDYKGWANGLKNAGYATDPKYPDKLIGLIERYELFLLDREVLGTLSNNKPIINEKPTQNNNKPFETQKPVVNETQNKPTVVTNNQANNDYHVVEAGQTLYSISRLYQLNTDDLMKINQLESTSLFIGQKLIVNKNQALPKKTTDIDEGQTHLVSAGDTLFNISKRYGLTVDELKKLNNLSDNSISLGQKLKIK